MTFCDDDVIGLRTREGEESSILKNLRISLFIFYLLYTVLVRTGTATRMVHTAVLL
jgi:hypothetical protein